MDILLSQFLKAFLYLHFRVMYERENRDTTSICALDDSWMGLRPASGTVGSRQNNSTARRRRRGDKTIRYLIIARFVLVVR